MTQGDCTSLDLPWWNVALSHHLNVDCQFGFCWYKIGMVHIYSWESLLLLHCLPAMANNASNTDSLYNDTRGLNQPGWQKLAAFGEGINDHKNFRQARVHYFDNKCVVIARNCRSAHWTLCIYHILVHFFCPKSTVFDPKSPFLPKDFQNVRISQ